MLNLQIRRFQPGDEPILREVFYRSVHGLAQDHYTPEQLRAWAPREYDVRGWAQRLRGNRPFVAERSGQVVAFADVQADGYIDQFFVAPEAAGQGVGGALMRQIEREAGELDLARLTSHVSLAAQPFFQHFGFVVVESRTVTIGDVSLRNARMEKQLWSELPP
jgi:putative acetyltransferase